MRTRPGQFDALLGQRDQGDFDFPLDPFGIPLPLETTRALALDPGLSSAGYRLSCGFIMH